MKYNPDYDFIDSKPDDDSQLSEDWKDYVEHLETMVLFYRAKVVNAISLIEKIQDGLDDIHYPKKDGTREWIGELGIYLRGNAATILLMSAEDMQKLERFNTSDICPLVGGDQ